MATMKIVLISSVSLALFLAVNCLTETQIIAIDTLIDTEFRPAHNIPGVGFTIVHGDQSLAKGYGYRNIETNQLVNNDTLFAIGSVSKSFTALCVVRVLSNAFAELGESVLDVPIRELMPQVNFTLIDRFRSENSNFRDLLSHRACTFPENWGITVWPYKSKDEYIYRQRYSIPVCQFRTEFVYNNGLIQVAGELAAIIANKSFEELLTELFRDIGMTQSSFIREFDDLESIPMLSKPYYYYDGLTKRFNMELMKNVVPAPGSGGIISTPNEFIKYLNFHLNNGHNGTHQIIPAHVIQWLRNLKNVLPFEFKKDDSQIVYGDMGYGLGLFLGTYDGYLKVAHGGYLPPYFSLMTMVPELNIGLFTTTNGPGAYGKGAIIEDLHFKIMNIIQDVTNSTAQKIGTSILDYEVQKPKQPLVSLLKPQVETKSEFGQNEPKDVTGVYGHPTSGEFNVTRHNSTHLYLNYGRFGQAYLIQRGSSDIYETIWDSDIYQMFVTSDGEVPETLIDFTDPLVAYLETYGIGHPFHKDEHLETLPGQPWLPGTCSSSQ